MASGKKFGNIAAFFLKAAAAAVLVSVLIMHNREGLKEVFSSFDYKFLIPALGCYIIHIAASAWRWHRLAAASGFQMSRSEALSLTFQGYFFSLILPAGAIGGDIVRITFLAGRTPAGSRWDGTMTVIADRIIGMVALFGCALAGIAFNYRDMLNIPMPGGLDDLRFAAVWILIGICAGGIGMTAVLFCHDILEKIPLLKKIFDLGFFRRLVNVLDICKKNWRILAETLTVSVFAIHLMLAAGVWFLAAGVEGADIPAGKLVNAVFTGNIAGLLPSFSGIGFRDTAISALLAGSCTAAQAAAVPLCYTVILLLGNLSGGIFFIFGNFRSKTQFRTER